MAFEFKPEILGTQAAAADLSTKQFFACKADNTGKVALASTLGERVIGVIHNKPKAGEPVDVQFGGVTKMIASTTIIAGANVTTAADGRAVTAAAGHHILGVALDGAGGANELVSVLLGYRGTA